MSNATKLILALVVLALAALPALANPFTEPDLTPPNLVAQTTIMFGDDGEIWLVTYVDLDGSGTFNDRREFLRAELLRPAQR